VVDFDLDAYCARVGYGGPREATFSVLAALQQAQLTTIAFENLNPFLGYPVELDPAALEAKLVRRARGGYCFEVNALFMHALRALGFRVTPLAARVRATQPDDAPQTPLSHMVLLVYLPEGDFLCDTGFGGQSPAAPLRFEMEREQETRFARFRLNKIATGYELALRLPERWGALYHFSLEVQAPRDYDVFNWYTSTHPASRFVNNIVAARIDGDVRYTLLNREFGIHHSDGRVERSELKTAGEVHDALTHEFRIAIAREDIERNWLRVPEL
jgi:N-hydroxyarylamine O-acetyltransferase